MENINKIQSKLNRHKDTALGLEFVVPPGEELAPEVDKEMSNVPEGYAVVVLGYGDQTAYMYPQLVAVGNRKICIQIQSRRAIPINHLCVLLDAKIKKTIQPKPGVPAVEYEANRFDLNILKLPESKEAEIKEKMLSIRERAEQQQIHIS